MSAAIELWCKQDLQQPEELVTGLGDLALFVARGPGKEANEDACLVIDRGDQVLLGLADGMGGLAGGAQASEAALEAIADRTPEGRFSIGGLVESVDAANQEVQGLGLGAGTTLVLVLLERGAKGLHMRSLHVGDSACFLAGPKAQLRFRTLSHSLTAYGQEAGLLSERQAMRHEERHVVSNAMGGPSMRMDVGPSVRMVSSDSLLLCSDGLTDNLWEQEILRGIGHGDPGHACALLARLAQKRMGRRTVGQPNKPDDLSLLLFQPNGEPEQ